MRGVYSSIYLAALAKEAAARRKIGDLDVGAAFDLIVGTSTGGIIACALAANVPLDDVSELYRLHGKRIFPAKMPSGFGLDLISQLWTRPKHLQIGATALEGVLVENFGDMTLGDVYAERGVALAIPAIEMSRHRSWVFKTPHLDGQRDEKFRLVDVCLATTAAPLYRSMARVESPMTPGYYHVFVDGGLWANNPVLVGLIEALEMTQPGDRIEIFSLGTCPRPAGDIFGVADETARGLIDWKFGGEAAALAVDSQECAYDEMVAMIAKHVHRDCRIVRFPRGPLPAKTMSFLDLDETSEKAMEIFAAQAHDDVSLTLSVCDRNPNDKGRLLADLLEHLPEANGRKRSR